MEQVYIFGRDVMGGRTREKTIVISSCIVLIFLLVRFVPRHKLREAHVSFMFQQIISWFFGLAVVEKNYIQYPYRFVFKKANKSSFMFEYFIFPAITVFYNVYYPKTKGRVFKVLYTGLYSGLITGLELIAVTYTKLITYRKWKWYWSFGSLYLAFFISRIYHRWFFKVRY